MDVKNTSTVTEYDSLESHGFTLDFKRTEKDGEITVICYVRKDGASCGFLTYNRNKQSLLIQMSNVNQAWLLSSNGVLTDICAQIASLFVNAPSPMG